MNRLVTPLESDKGVPRAADGRKGFCGPDLGVRRFGVLLPAVVAYDLDRQFVVRYRLDPTGRPVIASGEFVTITEHGGISVHWREGAS
jgi:hypothetical protein